MLSFSRWRLDYCAMGYILPESRAANMSAVLRQLRAVTAEQAAAKRERCAEAAPWLSYSSRDPQDGPGAVSHLLSELCQLSEPNATKRRQQLRLPTFDERCLLLTDREETPQGSLWR